MDVTTVGRLLFGRSLRLRVALWILRESGGSFFLSQAAAGIGYSASGISSELDRLIELQMIRRDADAGSRRVYFTVVPHPLWEVFAAANRLVDASSDSGVVPEGEDGR